MSNLMNVYILKPQWHKSSLMTVVKATRTDLCWHADRSLHLQVLLFSPSDQVGTDCGLRSTGETHSHHISSASVMRLQLRIAYTVTRICLCKFLSSSLRSLIHTLSPEGTHPSPEIWHCGWWGWCGCGEWPPRSPQVPYRCLWKPACGKHVQNCPSFRFCSFHDRFLIHFIDHFWQSKDNKSGWN